MIRTRFPPEPNGYLHLGHLKSIYYNFNYPFDQDSNQKELKLKLKLKECYLRFDDTNPKTEKKEYVDAILEDLEWLGYKPDHVSYTSDYFNKIADHTRKLIKDGYVYGDFSTSEEIKEERKIKGSSPYRDMGPEETLKLFDSILNKYDSRNPILRLRIPVEDRTNECMHDPIIYRMIEEDHYRTGDTYKAYPTYEYSHYIVDSIEGITHSFCTLEFYIRRPLSFWILDKLGLPRMVIEETNRLLTDFGLLSKRKIKALLEQGDLTGWDDPRLLTLKGLRKKGLTPEILKEFCAQQGYTKNMNAVTNLQSFEAVIRNNLNLQAPRRMAVFNRLKVTLVNFDKVIFMEKPLYPNQEGKEDQKVITTLSSTVYIEREDFRLEANKKYKRWTPAKQVRLKYAGIIKYISHTVDENGEIDEITAKFISEESNTEKVNGTIHWVSYHQKNWQELQTRKLTILSYPDPKKNESGTKEVKEILLDFLEGYSEEGNWQFERMGYYHLDSNREITLLVPLKEDNKKNIF